MKYTEHTVDGLRRAGHTVNGKPPLSRPINVVEPMAYEQWIRAVLQYMDGARNRDSYDEKDARALFEAGIDPYDAALELL